MTRPSKQLGRPKGARNKAIRYELFHNSDSIGEYCSLPEIGEYLDISERAVRYLMYVSRCHWKQTKQRRNFVVKKLF